MSFRSSLYETTIRNYQQTLNISRTDPVPKTTALDFLLAYASSGLRVWSPTQLAAFTTSRVLPKAGQGGFSVVEVAETPDKRPIVIKNSLRLYRPQFAHTSDEFAQHFAQLCLELRILTHPYLRSHENIIDILGLCAGDYSGAPSISLVLEYAPGGSLDDFLLASQITDPYTLCDFAFQVSSGLESLHALNICHGDVKPSNVLVLPRDGRWICKVSDFGNCITTTTDDIEESIEAPQGTPLYNAPEIRRLGFSSKLSIIQAMRSDIFSFGLTLWDILKRGNPFYNEIFGNGQRSVIDVDCGIDSLNRLPKNDLLHRSTTWLKTQSFPIDLDSTLSDALNGALQEDPDQRPSITTLKTLLDAKDAQLHGRSDHKAVHDLGASVPLSQGDAVIVEPETQKDALVSWTGEHAVYEVIETLRDNGMFTAMEVEPLKTVIEELVVAELSAIISHPHSTQQMRAHAAMNICECEILGFGFIRNTDIVSILEQAASYGSCKANTWLSRVRTVPKSHSGRDLIGSTSRIEPDLSDLPCELYLINKIRQNGLTEWKCKSTDGGETASLLPKLRDTISIQSFRDAGVDSLDRALPTNLDGHDEVLHQLLQDSTAAVASEYNLSPVHLACIGGRLSILKLLLENGHQASEIASHGITTLHLCIFFEAPDVLTATNLLLKHGADPNIPTTSDIAWEDYDLVLCGTALDWAISTRNKELVSALLPVTQHSNGKRVAVAVSYYYWEIVDIILRQSADENHATRISVGSTVNTITRPFQHWIAHGVDRFTAIDRTVEVLQTLNVPLVTQLPEGFTSLMVLIVKAMVEEDFYLIERVIERVSSEDIKSTDAAGNSCLHSAISRAGKESTWTRTLELLANHYTATELEALYLRNYTYLHTAVIYDSPIGARVLLEKGINPNLTTRETNLTPLQLCLLASGSIDMCKVLKEFKADMNLSEETLPSLSILSNMKNSRLADYILTIDFSPGIYLDFLHETAFRFSQPSAEGADAREQFRHLLTIPKVVKYVDTSDPDGFTLLQRCAWRLCLDTVSLLLEAGANVDVGFQHERVLIYPLQMACVAARLEFGYDADDDTATEAEASKALGVCAMLLARHHARRDGLFQGITRLHLVSYVGLTKYDSELRAQVETAQAKGQWPSLKEPSSAHEYVEDAFFEDLAIVEGLKDALYAPQSMRQSYAL